MNADTLRLGGMITSIRTGQHLFYERTFFGHNTALKFFLYHLSFSNIFPYAEIFVRIQCNACNSICME